MSKEKYHTTINWLIATRRHVLIITLFVVCAHTLIAQNNHDSIKKYLFTNVDKAAYFGKALLDDATKLNDTEELAIAENLYGHTYLNRAIYDSALYHYSLALEHCKKGKHTAYSAHVYNSIASVYSYQKMYVPAMQNYQEALKVFTKENDVFWMSNVNYNIANIYKNDKEYEKAYQSYSKTLEQYLSLEDSRSASYALLGMGEAQFHLKQYEQAIALFERAIVSSVPEEDMANYALIHTLMGKALVPLKRDDEALIYFQKGVELARESGHMRQVFDSLEELRNYFFYSNNSVSFMELSHEYDSLSQEIYKQEQVDALAETNAKHRVQEMKEQMEYSELEKERIKLANTKLIVGIALMFCLIIGLLLLYRKLRNLNQTIALQKTELEGALKEKDVLMKEIHHRVKNNLQIVSSLLSLQTAFKEDNEVTNAELRNAFQRINSMALVHKELYSGADITRAHLKESIEELMQQVFNTFGDKLVIKTEVKIDPAIQFETEKAIAIILVMNELLTNSIKHNFVHTGSGQVFFKAHQSGNMLHISYQDYMPNEQDELTHQQLNNAIRKGFGSKLIEIFCKKLRAQYSMDIRSKGVLFQMSFENA